MPPSTNPLNQPKPLDFQIYKLYNDVEALEKENSLLEQSQTYQNEQNQHEIDTLLLDNKELKKQAQYIASCDPQKIYAAERLKERYMLDLKSQFDYLQAKKYQLQGNLDYQLKENPYVSLNEQKQRGQVDFKLGDVYGLDRIRELETSIDEADVRLREAKYISYTYEKLQKQIQQESIYYEERIRRYRLELTKTTQEFENFTQVCDYAVAATEQKQVEHEYIAEYCRQNRELRKQQLEEHRAEVKCQLERTAYLDLREDFNISKTAPPKSAHQETRQTGGFISLLYHDMVLALHNFKSPTEFVNACKNQAVVNDDLNDQEEAHARIKKLNYELLETQQAIYDCYYDLESAGALQKKVLVQIKEQIQQFYHDNQFKEELMQNYLIKLNNLKNALINTTSKLPLLRLADDELARKLGIDQFTADGVAQLRENPYSFDALIYKIPEINKQCEFAETVTLYRLASFREALYAVYMSASNAKPQDSEFEHTEAEKAPEQPAEQEQYHEPVEAKMEEHLDSEKRALEESTRREEQLPCEEYADDLYINLDEDEDLPIDDLQLNEANVKIQFPKSRPNSKPPMGRGKSGKAVVIGEVPQHLNETYDRKTMKQMSLALVEANKQPVKEE